MKVVLDEDEWALRLERIVRRDFFPNLTAQERALRARRRRDGEEDGPGEHALVEDEDEEDAGIGLDEFCARFDGEDNAAFARLQKREVAAQQARAERHGMKMLPPPAPASRGVLAIAGGRHEGRSTGGSGPPKSVNARATRFQLTAGAEGANGGEKRGNSGMSTPASSFSGASSAMFAGPETTSARRRVAAADDSDAKINRSPFLSRGAFDGTPLRIHRPGAGGLEAEETIGDGDDDKPLRIRRNFSMQEASQKELLTRRMTQAQATTPATTASHLRRDWRTPSSFMSPSARTPVGRGPSQSIFASPSPMRSPFSTPLRSPSSASYLRSPSQHAMRTSGKRSSTQLGDAATLLADRMLASKKRSRDVA